MYKASLILFALIFSVLSFGKQKEVTIRCGISEIDIYNTHSKGRFEAKGLAIGDSINIKLGLNQNKALELQLSSIDHQIHEFFNTRLMSISLFCDHDNLIDQSHISSVLNNKGLTYSKIYNHGKFWQHLKTREESSIEIDFTNRRGKLYSKCRHPGPVSSVKRSEISLDLAGCKILP